LNGEKRGNILIRNVYLKLSLREILRDYDERIVNGVVEWVRRKFWRR